MTTPSAVVIGAGVGGLAAAIHLANRGFRVTVIEKNAHPGGRCDRYSHDGHHFDTGPTLLVMPLLYEDEFAALGASLHDLIDLKRVDPTYHLIFDDGSQLALTSDLKAMCDQLEAIEPGSMNGFLRYLDEGRLHYEVGMKRLVQRDFRTASEFFALSNLPLLMTLKPFVNHYNHMSAFFSKPRLKAAFTFQDVYMGLSPFDAPATFSLMPYSELAHGVWYPMGGMYRIVEVLVGIAKQAGVEFVFNAEAKQIKVEGGRATAVRLSDGCMLNADFVIANADLPYVYQNLLPDLDLADEFTKKRFSCSTISFFWGVDRRYEMLAPHTLFLADDYRENFETIIHDLLLPANPSLYIHAPTRLDASMAPPDQDTLIAVIPVGHLDETGEQDWQQIKSQARTDVLRRLALLGITDLEAHLKFEVCYTPLSWQKHYYLTKGATHGLAHTLTQLGYMRPHNRHPRYHNLYFVGASTHPGTGMPTALVSARLVAERMLDDLDGNL